VNYFGGALDAFLAASAAAAFFRDSFSACFFSAAILRGLVSAAELSLAVRAFAAPDGATAFGPPACPPSLGETCPQALVQINAATGNIAIQVARVYTMITSLIQVAYVNPQVCTLHRTTRSTLLLEDG
jgi:hypothetical protein